MRTHPISTFYVLAFAISWIGFVPVIAGSFGVSIFADPLWKICLVLPGGGPAIAAAITSQWSGAAGHPLSRLRSAAKRYASPWWYLIAALLPVLLLLAAGQMNRILPLSPQYAQPRQSGSEVLPYLLLSLLANPWEEIGWRGFAYPRLQARYNPMIAAVLVGVLWGFWHLPLFVWPESSMSSFAFWPWFAALVGESCILAWLFNSTGQNLLVAVLFHVAFNVSSALVGVQSHVGLALVNGLVALGLLLRFGSALGYTSSAQVAKNVNGAIASH